MLPLISVSPGGWAYPWGWEAFLDGASALLLGLESVELPLVSGREETQTNIRGRSARTQRDRTNEPQQRLWRAPETPWSAP